FVPPLDHLSCLLAFPTRRSADLWEGPCCELARAPNVNRVRPRTSTEDCERNTVSEGANPVTNTAAVRGADEHPQSGAARRPVLRSEEHTSELQSRFELVCRLLLE